MRSDKKQAAAVGNGSTIEADMRITLPCKLGTAFLMLFALTSNAQNTPAPCSPANIEYQYYQQSCWNSVDCSTGYQCLDLRVGTDLIYGTTCSVEYVAICSQPGFPNIAKKEKSHVETILAAVRTRNRS